MRVAAFDFPSHVKLLFEMDEEKHKGIGYTLNFSPELLEKHGVSSKENLPVHIYYQKLRQAFLAMSQEIDSMGLDKEPSEEAVEAT